MPMYENKINVQYPDNFRVKETYSDADNSLLSVSFRNESGYFVCFHLDEGYLYIGYSASLCKKQRLLSLGMNIPFEYTNGSISVSLLMHVYQVS